MALDLFSGLKKVTEPDDGASVILGLQQGRHELDLIVGNTVQSEEISDIARLEADPPQLEAADFSMRRADCVSGGFAADTARLPKPT